MEEFQEREYNVVRDGSDQTKEIHIDTITVWRPDFSVEVSLEADIAAVQPGADGTYHWADDSGDGEKLMDSREI